ncbi:6429_t:CDS:2 [Scutellospora calospora]|uniref:6429_t:CDS:1 n=1 Tax=Scutellospora calospora TaxID=85575 RepID=A0ACA9JUF3_9GLOM|nr:6429_t:CDS:2 [Scutellospora calospora]
MIVKEDYTDTFADDFEDNNQEIAELHLKKYTKSIEFSLYRKCFEVNNARIICRQTFEYSFSGEQISNKNSLYEDDFYRHWTRLLEQYPQSQGYLNHTLHNSGIQSTQRVKVMNRLIKEGTSSTSSLSIGPIFHKVFELMKKYLSTHILSIQEQQIYNIQPSDIIEIWELLGIVNLNKYYIILLIDSRYLCTCLSVTSRRLYLEDIQDNDDQLNSQHTVRVVTQFQQENYTEISNDLHIFNTFKPTVVFTFKMKKQLRREIWSTALLLVKKGSIINANNKDKENLYISDPLIQKRCERQFNKCIKLASEKKSYGDSRNSAINPTNPNLNIRLLKTTSDNKLHDNSSESSVISLLDYNLNIHKDRQQYIYRNPIHTLDDIQEVDANNTLSKDEAIASDTVNEDIVK